MELKDFVPDFKDPKDAKGHRKHFLLGVGIAAIVPLILVLAGFGFGVSMILAFIAGSGLFFGKEWFDTHRKNGSGWSWADIVAGYVGLFVPFLAMFLLF